MRFGLATTLSLDSSWLCFGWSGSEEFYFSFSRSKSLAPALRVTKARSASCLPKSAVCFRDHSFDTAFEGFLEAEGNVGTTCYC